MDSNIMLRGAATAAPVIPAEGESGVVPGMVNCPMCQRSFKGVRGLIIHQRSAHPLVFHTEHQVATRVKARWTPEDRDRVAFLEADLLVSGVKPGLINSELVKVFKEWSRERIKGLRKKQDYKDQVSELVARAQALKCQSVPEDTASETPRRAVPACHGEGMSSSQPARAFKKT